MSAQIIILADRRPLRPEPAGNPFAVVAEIQRTRAAVVEKEFAL